MSGECVPGGRVEGGEIVLIGQYFVAHVDVKSSEIR